MPQTKIVLPSIQFLQARNYLYVGGFREIELIVLHDMEYPERVTAAEECLQFFHTTTVKASTQYCVDSNSIGQSVLDMDVCYGAGGVNHNGIHIEHAGYASQTAAQWLDAYGVMMLMLSAKLTAFKCQQYGLPAVWVDEAGLERGDKGVTDHRTAARVFGGDHYDPGEYFPRTTYMRWVNDLLLPPKEWDEMATEAELKKAFREVLAEEGVTNKGGGVVDRVKRIESDTRQHLRTINDKSAVRATDPKPLLVGKLDAIAEDVVDIQGKVGD